MPPARVIRMESTEAKIGRSMKKRENTRFPPRLSTEYWVLGTQYRTSLRRPDLADADDQASASVLPTNRRIAPNKDGFAVELLRGFDQLVLLLAAQRAEVQFPGQAGVRGEHRAGLASGCLQLAPHHGDDFAIGPHALQSADDDQLVGGNAGFRFVLEDHTSLFAKRAETDGTVNRSIDRLVILFLRLEDVDELLALVGAKGAFLDERRLVGLADRQADADEQARFEHVLLVVEDAADRLGAGATVEEGRGEIDLTLV